MNRIIDTHFFTDSVRIFPCPICGARVVTESRIKKRCDGCQENVKRKMKNAYDARMREKRRMERPGNASGKLGE